MDKNKLTEEQINDINERVKKAAQILEELLLKPEAAVQAINTGDDVFGLKVICYLQDLRYQIPKDL